MTATQDVPPSSSPGRIVSGRAHMARSRAGGIWVSLIVAAFVLLLLLIFILQNGAPAKVSFLGAHGTLPVGVALLFAAVFGALLVALPGTARIVQLRLAGRRSAVDVPPPLPDDQPPDPPVPPIQP